MEKIANYKEVIYKEAGVLGGATMGIIGGTMGGTSIGNAAAKARNKFTFDKERKQLNKDFKSAKKNSNKSSNRYVDYTLSIDRDLNNTFDSYMAGLSNEERDSVTMGQLESMLKAKAKVKTKEKSAEMSKQASLASTRKAALVTGIPMAAISGIGTYKYETNKDAMKVRTKHLNEGIKFNEDVISGRKPYDTTPAIASAMKLHNGHDLDGESILYYKNSLNKELKRKGINPDDVKYKDYNKMVESVINEEIEWGKVNAKPAVKSYLNKKASQELSEELIKEAGIVSHVSKMTNGIKRYGQLLTGSKAKGLSKSLKTMQNAPAGNLKDSLEMGNKMFDTQKQLGSELKKVKATRMGTAVGVGAGVAGTAALKPKQETEAVNV